MGEVDLHGLLAGYQRERTIAKQRITEIEAIFADSRRRKLQVYDRDAMLDEKKALVVRLTTLRRLVRETEMAIGEDARARVRETMPSSLTGALRSVIARAGAVEEVYSAACAFVDEPNEAMRKQLTNKVRKARNTACLERDG